MQEWQTFLIKNRKSNNLHFYRPLGFCATSQLNPPSTKAARAFVTEEGGSIAGSCKGCWGSVALSGQWEWARILGVPVPQWVSFASQPWWRGRAVCWHSRGLDEKFRLASIRLPQALQSMGISEKGANSLATCVLSSGLLMLLTQAFLSLAGNEGRTWGHLIHPECSDFLSSGEEGPNSKQVGLRQSCSAERLSALRGVSRSQQSGHLLLGPLDQEAAG